MSIINKLFIFSKQTVILSRRGFCWQVRFAKEIAQTAPRPGKGCVTQPHLHHSAACRPALRVSHSAAQGHKCIGARAACS